MRKLIQCKKLEHILLVLFLLTECASGWMVWNNYQQNYQAYIEKSTREFEIGLMATLHHFEEVANTMLHENTLSQSSNDVMNDIQSVIDSRDTSNKATLRLDDLYNHLIQRGFKGVTIVAPNKTVILRLHNRDYYGDSITTINALLDSVSRNSKPAIGFYAGGTAAGYCLAIPMKKTEKGQGFVLLTIDNMALQHEMKKIFPYEFVFLINKESVLKTTPYTMLSGYHFSDLSVDYFYAKNETPAGESTVKQYIPPSEIILFNKINKREIESGLLQNQSFGLHAQTDHNNSYTGLFFPVAGPDGNPAAFIISYSSDSTLRDYKKDGFIIAVISSLLIALIFAFIIFSIHTFRRLSEKNQKLAESEKQLKELNISKDKFFSIIAHDLRNPFHGLVGLAEVLSEDFDKMPPEKAHRFHQLIYESSRQGYQLVNNLLEWTRVQTGRISYLPEKTNLNRLIEEVIGQLQTVASAKQITIETELAPGLLVWSDYQMASAILRNLLSNAIKFSSSTNKIIVRTTRTTNYARISVIDFGVGMTKEAIANLWSIEISHSSKGTNGEPGTGLGLILANEFAERNKGSIHVKSEPDQGSTFTFTLPLFIL